MFNRRNEQDDFSCRKEKRKKYKSSCNINLGDNYKFKKPNIEPNVSNRKGGDRLSEDYIRSKKAKMNKLRQLIYRQLQHYSKTGVRLYSPRDLMSETGWSSLTTIRKYTKIIFQDIFADHSIAKLTYDMTCGRIKTSYHSVKKNCFDKGLILETTSTQWFELLKNGGLTRAPVVDVRCEKNDDHKFSVRIDLIEGCRYCYYENLELNYQNIIQLASKRGLKVISFKDDTKPLTEIEFKDLLEVYKMENLDPDNYKSDSNVYINLRWKHLDCGFIFERAYYAIQKTKVKQYCPKCYSSIDQQQTFEAFQEAFQGFSSSSFVYDFQLSRILPNPAILLRNNYESIRYPNVHIDMFCVAIIKSQEFRIAVEHQGPQHYYFEDFLRLVRSRDEEKGIYKTDAEYRFDWNQQLERDRAKADLFKELNKDGYYLIHVPYTISVSKRKKYILQEFIKQTGKLPGQSNILDWVLDL
ncbi:MAG: hypothetical protein ACFFCE_02630 [Promethearchaeota archaeon]